MTGTLTNRNVRRQSRQVVVRPTHADRKLEQRQAGSQDWCRPSPYVSTLQTDEFKHRLTRWADTQSNRQAKRKTNRVVALICGHSSTVILHSVSAYLLSLLLLQNLLICKSIAYIFGSIHHLYFCAIYLPRGGADGDRWIIPESFQKK